MRKKFLSLLLVLVMAVMILPVTAMAAVDNSRASISAGPVGEDGYVMLTVSVKNLKDYSGTVSSNPEVKIERDFGMGWFESTEIRRINSSNSATYTFRAQVTEDTTFSVSFTRSGKTPYTNSVKVEVGCKHTQLTEKTYKLYECEETGTGKYWQCANEKCGVCFKTNDASGEEFTADEFKPIAAHSTATHQGKVDATCTTDGKKEYWQCDSCKKFFDSAECTNELTEADLIIPAGHTKGEQLSEGKEATCLVPGVVAHWQCANCDAMLNEDGEVITSADTALEATGHKFVKHLDARPVTCNEEGYDDCWKCENCGLYFGSDSDKLSTLGEETDENFRHAADQSLHVKGDHVDGTVPNCSSSGTKEHWLCENCGKAIDEDGKLIEELGIPKDMTNHIGDRVNHGKKDPTCKENGNEAYWMCMGCFGCFAEGEDGTGPAKTEADFVIEASEDLHKADLDSVVEGTPATCKEPGRADIYYCSGCQIRVDVNGKPLTETELPIDPLNHGERKEVPAKAPTCKEDGNEAYWQCKTCTKCFAMDDKVGVYPKNKSDFTIKADPELHVADLNSVVKGTPATCKEPGRADIYYCSGCQLKVDVNGKPLTETELPIDPLNHGERKEVPAKAPTCKEDGNEAYWQCKTCTKCFAMDDEVGENPKNKSEFTLKADADAHIVGELCEGYPATCTEIGRLDFYYCAVEGCEKRLGEDGMPLKNTEIPALGHKWVDGEEVSGVEYQVCENCGKYQLDDGTIIDAIPALHTLDFHPGTPATCTEAGEMDYWFCTDEGCGAKFASLEATAPLTDTVIPAKGHKLQQLVNVRDSWVCIDCGLYFGDQDGTTETEKPAEVEKHVLLEHAYAKPSCVTGDGNIRYFECVSCGNAYENNNGTGLVSPKIPYMAGNAEHHNLVEFPANEEHIPYFQCQDCGMCFDGKTSDATVLDPSDLGNTAEPGPHAMKYQPEVPATCTTEGTKGHWLCLANHGCNLYFADSAAKDTMTKAELVLPASHSMIYFKGYEPTLDTEGRLGYHYCTVCKMVMLDGSDTLCTMEEARQNWTIEKLPEQSDIQMHKKVAPTCTEDGMKKHWTAKDERTGETLYFTDAELTNSTSAEALILPALGHDIVADGDHYKCSRCGKLFADSEGNTDYVKPGDTECKHQAGNRSFVSGTEATCTKTGTADHYRCACGQLFDVDGNAVTAQQLSIAALGHDTVYVKATETTVEYWQCQSCGGIFADAQGRVPLNSTVKDNLEGMDHDLDLGGSNWGLSTSGGKHNEP